MREDYSYIEIQFERNYKKLLEAVKPVDAVVRSEKTKRFKRINPISEFFDRPAVQAVAAALALVFTVGGVYAFIFYFSGKNLGGNPPDTETTEETNTETAPQETDTISEMSGSEDELYDTSVIETDDPFVYTTDEITIYPETTVPETTTAETTAAETTTAETTAAETDESSITGSVITDTTEEITSDSIPEDTVTTADTEPVQDDIMNYLHFEIIDPTENQYEVFGTEKYALLNGIDECSFKTVVIPDNYEGYPVKEILSTPDGFSKIKNLTSISLPDSIIRMEVGMFIGCDRLTDVKLPANLREIPESTFWCCKSLKNVVFPDKLTKIGNKAFYECKSLKFDVFPSSLKFIGLEAFVQCTKLTKLHFNDGLEYIGNGAFYGCQSVKEIEIPRSVIGYGSESFAYTSIKSITVPPYQNYYDKIGAIHSGYRMFLGCTILEDITLEEGIKVINVEMFCGCTNLKKLALPQSVESIEVRAFADSAIESLYIGKNVSDIDPKAFDNFAGQVTIDPDNPYYTYENGILMHK